MKKLTILIVLFLLYPCLVLGSSEDVFKTSYECFDLKGDKRWKATTQIMQVTDGRENIYLITEKGEGIFSGFKDKMSWIATLEFKSSKDTIIPIESQKHIFDENGKMVTSSVQKFDFKNKNVSCTRKNLLTGKKKEKNFKFKHDIVNRLMLGLYIQKVLENKKTEDTVQLLSSKPRLYKVKIKVIGQETININRKEKKAYKLCLDPDIGLLNIFKVFLPKAYTWHSATPEYEWLKYVGLESTVNSKKVEIRTVD